MRRLYELTAGERGRYAAAVVAILLASACLFAAPLLGRAAIDGALGAADNALVRAARAIGGGARTVLVLGGIGTVLAVAAAGVFTYLRGRWATLAAQGVVRRLRDRLYRHLGELPCAFHDRAETGDLVQRCSSDVETLRVFYAAQIVEIARTLLMVATVVPLLLLIDARMTAITFCLLPLIVGAGWVFFRRIRRFFLDVDEAEGAMTAVLQENLTGVRVVRAFARQDHEIERFGARNADHRDKHARFIRLLGNYWATSDVLVFLQLGLVLFAGIDAMRAGTLTVGTLYAFTTTAGLVIWPVRQMGRVLADAGKATVALGRIDEVLRTPAETGLDGDAPEAGLGAIRARGLRFAFGDAEPVLRGLDLDVAAGETVAILGAPGSGKSTFVQMLLRLYDGAEGSLTLDGVEVADLPRRVVRRRVAAVLQDPFLYSRTIEANVRVGRAGASRAQIEACAEAAGIHASIESFERGYGTIVGERGVTLSGGQRQRLALARALVKEAPVLVLDDALSAVDTETEEAILDALAARRGRATTIVIAHRLSSVRYADRVYVLEAGRVVQSGTHAELRAVPGPYRRLWRIQDALEEELGVDLRRAEEQRP